MTTESPISQKILNRIQTLSNTGTGPDNILFDPAKYREVPAPYAKDLAPLLEKQPDLINTMKDNFDPLITEFNKLSMTNSPLLALFPHSQNLRELLIRMPLPTLQEIQNASDGEILISEGVENGARLIELGNFAES